MPIRTLFLFGTRPEAIKLAPLVRALAADPRFEVEVCASSQHGSLLQQMLAFFALPVDHDLRVMREAIVPHRTLLVAKIETMSAIADLDDIVTEADALIALVKDAKGSHYAPKTVDFVEEIPLSPLGKPDKKALRAQYWGGAERLVN